MVKDDLKLAKLQLLLPSAGMQTVEKAVIADPCFDAKVVRLFLGSNHVRLIALAAEVRVLRLCATTPSRWSFDIAYSSGTNNDYLSKYFAVGRVFFVKAKDV